MRHSLALLRCVGNFDYGSLLWVGILPTGVGVSKLEFLSIDEDVQFKTQFNKEEHSCV